MAFGFTTLAREFADSMAPRDTAPCPLLAANAMILSSRLILFAVLGDISTN